MLMFLLVCAETALVWTGYFEQLLISKVYDEFDVRALALWKSPAEGIKEF